MAYMTTGHMFLVSHHREGFDPLHATYAIAAGADAHEAQELLAMAFVEPDLGITYERALTADEIKKLGLEAGQFRSFWPTREL